MSLISRSSATRSWFVSALAAADSISLRMSCAAPRVEKRSSGSASSSGRPRTWSATRRALRGATRTKRARALTMGRSEGSFGLGLAFALVSAFGFAAGFFAAGFFAGVLDVALSAALLSAVLEVASAAPLPFVAVSALGFGFAAGFFAAGFLAGAFLAAGFFVAGFFAWSFSVFFSSAIG